MGRQSHHSLGGEAERPRLRRRRRSADHAALRRWQRHLAIETSLN